MWCVWIHCTMLKNGYCVPSKPPLPLPLPPSPLPFPLPSLSLSPPSPSLSPPSLSPPPSPSLPLPLPSSHYLPGWYADNYGAIKIATEVYYISAWVKSALQVFSRWPLGLNPTHSSCLSWLPT